MPSFALKKKEYWPNIRGLVTRVMSANTAIKKLDTLL